MTITHARLYGLHMVATEQVPQPTTKPQPDRQRQRGKILPGDVQAMADLIIGCRMTELEACSHLGLNYNGWMSWKSRHEPENGKVLACVRAAKLKQIMDSVEEVGLGLNGTRRDWRAQAWRGERLFPDRLAPTVAQSSPEQAKGTPVTVNVWIGAARAQSSTQDGAITIPEVKVLPETITTKEIDKHPGKG